MKREEDFYYDMENFYQLVEHGEYLNKPVYHPTRILTFISAFAYMVVVPIGYYKIYKFLRDHNLQVQGKCLKKVYPHA